MLALALALALALGQEVCLRVSCVSRHLDSRSLWEGGGFAVRCFQIIMFSIQVSRTAPPCRRVSTGWRCCDQMMCLQSQHSHLVIQQLLGHLDANSRSPASVRAGIVEVLSEAAVIEATGSVGEPEPEPEPDRTGPGSPI